MTTAQKAKVQTILAARFGDEHSNYFHWNENQLIISGPNDFATQVALVLRGELRKEAGVEFVRAINIDWNK